LLDSKEHHFFEFSLTYSALRRWVLMAFAIVLGGVAGLVSIIAAQLLLRVGGQESSDKHGISARQASRLGGVVIVLFVILATLWQHVVAQQVVFPITILPLVAVATLFFAIGLFEDLYGVLKAKTRLLMMLATLVPVLVISPELILQHTDIALVDMILTSHVLMAGLFTLFGVVFLVNAYNTSDGANGLVSGLSICALLALQTLVDPAYTMFIQLTIVGCLIFMLFNLFVGRIFIGDGGAYFLGAIISLLFLQVSNAQQVTPWFILSFIFYPHADLLFSMLRRKAAGREVFGADNGHLHNLLYYKLSTIPMLSRSANSLTGIVVAGLFGLLPFMLYRYTESMDWLLVYASLWLLYVLCWTVLNYAKRISLGQNNRKG